MSQLAEPHSNTRLYGNACGNNWRNLETQQGEEDGGGHAKWMINIATEGESFFPGDLTFDTASLPPSAAAGIKRGLIDRNLGMDANMWKGRKEGREKWRFLLIYEARSLHFGPLNSRRWFRRMTNVDVCGTVDGDARVRDKRRIISWMLRKRRTKMKKKKLKTRGTSHLWLTVFVHLRCYTTPTPQVYK